MGRKDWFIEWKYGWRRRKWREYKRRLRKKKLHDEKITGRITRIKDKNQRFGKTRRVNRVINENLERVTEVKQEG